MHLQVADGDAVNTGKRSCEQMQKKLNTLMHRLTVCCWEGVPAGRRGDSTGSRAGG